MAKVGGKYRFLNGNRLENGGWVSTPNNWTVTIVSQKRNQFELEYDCSEKPEGTSDVYHGTRCWYNVGNFRSGLERGDILEEN
jgi:hypothetical protein